MPYPTMIWVYVNAHWNTKFLVFNPMPVHSGTVMSCCCCDPALTWVHMIFGWQTDDMSMVQSSDEHSTARPGNKSWRLPVIWKCIWNCLSVYEYLQNVLVYGRIWYIWIVVIISEYWDWNWTTCMKTNEKILTCLQAIEIHSDVTPSLAMMRSNRRGRWWICNECKPYLLTQQWW